MVFISFFFVTRIVLHRCQLCGVYMLFLLLQQQNSSHLVNHGLALGHLDRT